MATCLLNLIFRSSGLLWRAKIVHSKLFLHISQSKSIKPGPYPILAQPKPITYYTNDPISPKYSSVIDRPHIKPKPISLLSQFHHPRIQPSINIHPHWSPYSSLSTINRSSLPTETLIPFSLTITISEDLLDWTQNQPFSADEESKKCWYATTRT